jgi:hypothetical protein
LQLLLGLLVHLRRLLRSLVLLLFLLLLLLGIFSVSFIVPMVLLLLLLLLLWRRRQGPRGFLELYLERRLGIVPVLFIICSFIGRSGFLGAFLCVASARWSEMSGRVSASETERRTIRVDDRAELGVRISENITFIDFALGATLRCLVGHF